MLSGRSGSGCPCSGHGAAAASPVARHTPPAAQSHAVGTRFARRPANGAATATVSGHGVI
jgi:hypothetical protein